MDKKQRSEWQQHIYNFFEKLQYAVNSYDAEVGGNGKVPRFVRNEGFKYTVILPDGVKLNLTIEVDEKSIGSK